MIALQFRSQVRLMYPYSLKCYVTYVVSCLHNSKTFFPLRYMKNYKKKLNLTKF